MGAGGRLLREDAALVDAATVTEAVMRHAYAEQKQGNHKGGQKQELQNSGPGRL